MRTLSSPRFASVCALLALVVALGGTSYAAVTLPRASVGAAQLKANAVTAVKLKNGAVSGTKLANGAVTGAKVKDGSLSRSDLAPGVIPAVPTTPLVGLLPSGKTLQGYVEAIGQPGATSYVSTSTSFAFPLPADLGFSAVHVIAPGGPVPAGCSGTGANPGAAPGHLCVFVLQKANVGTYNVSSPAGDGQASRFGFSFFGITSTASFAYINASWAVTAP